VIAALARLPLARLGRRRRAWFPIAGWAALAMASALSARLAGVVGGADHVLRGPFATLVLPLLSYTVVSGALGGMGLRPALRGVVALGAVPGTAALASVLVSVGTSGIASGLLAALVCVVAHGTGDAPLLADLASSTFVAAVAGAAYAAWFCAGSAIGRGAMRGVFLVVDWVLGASAGFGALFTPRGHVVSLLGGALCFDLSRRTSSVMLVAIAVAYGAAAVRLARKHV
jgi:hypothetical protein